MESAAIDLGYWTVKSTVGDRLIVFPSEAGLAEPSRFQVGDPPQFIMEGDEGPIAVGEAAQEASRYSARLESRDWIESGVYFQLFEAGVAAAMRDAGIDRASLQLVTGLPVVWYDDRETLGKRLKGEHTVHFIDASDEVMFNVRRLNVIPQPFGALFDAALSESGNVADNTYTGLVGVIDIGSRTTDILTAKKLRVVEPKSSGIDRGCAEALKFAKKALSEEYPQRNLTAYEVGLLASGEPLKYFGEKIDVSDLIEDAVEPLKSSIIGEMTTVWGSAAGLDAVIITGGGAHLMGLTIKEEIPQAKVMDNPVTANVRGYLKFANRQI